MIAWGSANYAPFRWRDEREPFLALVVEILLQRTRAAQVVPVYEFIRNRMPSPADFVSAGHEGIASAIRSLGLAWRVRPLLELARQIVEEHSGVVPADRLVLRNLPGVGSYVAAAFESFHRNRRAAILDSNVVRLYSRLYGMPANPESRRDRRFIKLAERLTPRTNYRTFNYALLDFTREVCAPRPRCEKCPLAPHCVYYRTMVVRGR